MDPLDTTAYFIQATFEILDKAKGILVSSASIDKVTINKAVLQNYTIVAALLIYKCRCYLQSFLS